MHCKCSFVEVHFYEVWHLHALEGCAYSLLRCCGKGERLIALWWRCKVRWEWNDERLISDPVLIVLCKIIVSRNCLYLAINLQRELYAFISNLARYLSCNELQVVCAHCIIVINRHQQRTRGLRRFILENADERRLKACFDVHYRYGIIGFARKRLVSRKWQADWSIR